MDHVREQFQRALLACTRVSAPRAFQNLLLKILLMVKVVKPFYKGGGLMVTNSEHSSNASIRTTSLWKSQTSMWYPIIRFS